MRKMPRMYKEKRKRKNDEALVFRPPLRSRAELPLGVILLLAVPVYSFGRSGCGMGICGTVLMWPVAALMSLRGYYAALRDCLVTSADGVDFDIQIGFLEKPLERG